MGVQSETPLTMENPLAGRGIRFWPDTLLAHSGVKSALLATDVQQSRRSAELLEEQRLLYVAMTRSKFRTVLAPYSTTAKWRALAESDLGDDLPALLADSPRVPPLPRSAVVDATRRFPPPAGRLDACRAVPDPHQVTLPATFAPSGVAADRELADAARVHQIADLGPALVSGGGPGWDRVGDCIHSYLAAPLDSLDDAMKLQVAARLITRWEVGEQVSPDQVVECGERWTGFTAGTLRATRIDSEVPFAWTSADHQRAEGWLDQLLTVAGDDGTEKHIIVDHKTYPGTDPVTHVRRNYLGQMRVYRRAVTDITGSAPTGILIHLPLLGTVLEVSLP